MSPRTTHILGIGLLAAAAAVFIATGLVGVGRSSTQGEDFHVLHVAGTLWLQGESPYDPGKFAPLDLYGRVFPYPPTVAPLCMAAALVPRGTALVLMNGLNVLALLALIGTTTISVIRADPPRPASRHPLTPWLIAGFMLAAPFTTRTVWIAQSSIVVAACLVAGWRLDQRGHWLPGGLLLGVTLAKPQMVLVLFFWLLLDRRWRVLAVAGATALVMALPAMMTTGPVDTIAAWLGAMAHYQGQDHDTLGAMQVVGLPSLLSALGLRVPLAAALVAGLGLTWWLWHCRRRIGAGDRLALLVLLQLGFIWGHHTELVLLAPVVGALWLHIAHRPKLWVGAAFLLGLLFLPWRVVALTGVPVFDHWCTGVLVALGLWLLLLVRRERAGSPAVAG